MVDSFVLFFHIVPLFIYVDQYSFHKQLLSESIIQLLIVLFSTFFSKVPNTCKKISWSKEMVHTWCVPRCSSVHYVISFLNNKDNKTERISVPEHAPVLSSTSWVMLNLPNVSDEKHNDKLWKGRMTLNSFSITSLPASDGVQWYSSPMCRMTLLFVALSVPRPTDVHIFPHVDGIWDTILPSHLVLRETRDEVYKVKRDLPFWRIDNKGLMGGRTRGESVWGLELPQKGWPRNKIMSHWSFYAISAHRRVPVFLFWRLSVIWEKNI